MHISKIKLWSFFCLTIALLVVISGSVFVSCSDSSIPDLDHNLNISGIITDAIDKGPIEGVRVNLWHKDKAIEVTIAKGTTDINGKYHLGCAYDCFDLIRINCVAEGYVKYTSHVLLCQTKAQTVNIELNRIQ